MNEQDFTKKYYELISEKFPEVRYSIIEDLQIKAEFGKDNEITHFLDNAYRTYRLDPSDLNEIIVTYIASSASLYKQKESLNEEDIVPVIKHKSYFKELSTMSNKVKGYKNPDLVWEKYNDELLIVYAENTETSLRYFSKGDLGEIGLDNDSLLIKSIANMLRVLPEIEAHDLGGYFMVTAGGDFEASIILMQDIWTKSNFNVSGDILVAIPNRDILFVFGSEDKEVIVKVKKEVIKSYNEANHSISTMIFRWNGKRFSVYR